MIFFVFSMLIALVLLPGTVDLIIVTLGAFFPKKDGFKYDVKLKSVVIIPAHNEENSIESCISSIQKMEGYAHIVVVADNCEDQTASIAKSMGVEVLERFSDNERGKPYALNFAFQHLLKRDFEWFIIVDADTSISSNYLEDISNQIQRCGAKAVQARYSIRNAGDSMRTQLMNVAFYSQYLRMRGKNRLRLSTGIQGNGFALHRQIIEEIPLKANYITEDLAYHLELIMAGYRVEYCESARVFADMPVSYEGNKSQRSRWEGGRLRVVKDYLPKLFEKVIRGNFYCLEPMLDLLLLPLGYHLFGVMLLMILSSFSGLSLLYLIVVVVHVLSSIFLGGGTFKDVMALATVPYYVFWKIVNLGNTIKSSKKNIPWIRTDRGK
jgi:cellulose synthase/poly-beta-1,6-N-acetylglucosamine synthase-like glycosyltransferase